MYISEVKRASKHGPTVLLLRLLRDLSEKLSTCKFLGHRLECTHTKGPQLVVTSVGDGSKSSFAIGKRRSEARCGRAEDCSAAPSQALANTSMHFDKG